MEGEGGGEGEESCSQDTSPEDSNDEEEEEMPPAGSAGTLASQPLDNKVVLQLSTSASKPATYKLRDSRYFCFPRTSSISQSYQ